ncbi:mitochondrial 54S ribosomal protein YmL16 [Lepidopterella palustris CBS 459.81]|uniref:Mitochondrial 54S ribosomal protein YmL16 n=1 Tax=Lepidopterella palustris CBS 459.81 TaxID=1314670 RepID=A0A8E2E0S8_9PEZI|nr:mitochondrial 54S ribosomal protein YmL16 [Lepidopterella palustris CBS 459.81]
MFTPARRRCVNSVTAASNSSYIPSFLLPSFHSSTAARAFTTTLPCLSKIGSTPLSIPPEVTFDVVTPKPIANGRTSRTQPPSTVHIKGPLGALSMSIPPYIIIDKEASLTGPTLRVQDSRVREQREMWGTVRAYLQNHILGVSEGHNAILRLVGVGYRATVESTATTVTPEYPGQQFVNLKVGYSHPVELGIPKGVKASTPQPTRLLLEGIEKEVVMQFAAKIRMWRKPEPYKGKGIFVNGETIKLKNKKIK